MPYFVIPSRRLRQPKGAVRVSSSYPYAGNLRGAWLASSGSLLANASIRGGLGDLAAVSSPSVVGTPYGLGIGLNGTDQYLTNTANTAVTSFPMTFFIRCYVPSWSSYRIFDVSYGTGITTVVGLWSDGSYLKSQYYDGSSQANAETPNPSTNQWHTFASVHRSTSERSLYLNGVLVASNSDSLGALGSIDRVTVGYAPWGAQYLNAAIVNPLLFDCALPADEIAALHANQWRWAAPDRRVLYFGAGGGPSSYSLTADPNTLTLLGIASSLRTSRLITANPSSLSFSGVSANTLMARKVLANPSSLSLSGSNANTLATRKTVASPGALTLSGSTATFVVGKILVANPGTLSFSGSLANLKREAILSAQPATLTLSGSIAGLFRGKILIADPAALTLTGQSAATTTIRILPASPSNLGLVGQNATLSLSGSVQKARPGSDISTGGWLPSSGSDLYAMLDETSYNDSDYIYSPNNPTTETAEVKFTSVTDPGVHTGHILRFRLAAVGLDTVFDVYLMQGATQIATWQKTVTASNTVSYEETLTSGEAASITDYTDLRIKVVAHA